MKSKQEKIESLKETLKILQDEYYEPTNDFKKDLDITQSGLLRVVTTIEELTKLIEKLNSK